MNNSPLNFTWSKVQFISIEPYQEHILPTLDASASITESPPKATDWNATNRQRFITKKPNLLVSLDRYELHLFPLEI